MCNLCVYVCVQCASEINAIVLSVLARASHVVVAVADRGLQIVWSLLIHPSVTHAHTLPVALVLPHFPIITSSKHYFISYNSNHASSEKARPLKAS